MIGGEDIVIGSIGPEKAAALDSAVRVIFQHWRRAVFQDGITGEQYALFSEIPFGRVQELLIYRDKKSFNSWEELGAHPGNAGTMIHVIAADDGITLVVDDARSRIAKMVSEEIRRVLSIGFPWRMAA